MCLLRMLVWCVSLLVATAISAKEPPAIVILWPTSGPPVVRLTFGKFKQTASSGKQRSYMADVIAENVWNKKISGAQFNIYAFDKAKVRIADSWISISDVERGGIVKFQVFFNASGTIDSLELVPKSLPTELQAFLPPKTISITVNSVPQGAELKIDGTPAGTTPKIVQVTPGKHVLSFSKEGFNPGTFPLETTPDDVSGGSISYELGTSGRDTVELRDGSVLSGDVESMSTTEVLMRIGGTAQHLNRNLVKRIVLIQRAPPSE
jgi:PEGA domain